MYKQFQCFDLGIADDENDYYDRWTRHYSEAVKTNMCDYFGWFDVKISEETKTYCQTLPGKKAQSWTCADFWIIQNLVKLMGRQIFGKMNRLKLCYKIKRVICYSIISIKNLICKKTIFYQLSFQLKICSKEIK